MAQPSSIWSSLMFRAGRSRITLPCVALISSRRSRQAATTSRRRRQVEADHHAEDADVADRARAARPRSASKWPRNRSPMARPRSSRPSCSIVSMAASPARQAIGLPPKVLACIPGLSVAATSGRGDHHARRDPAGQRLGAGQDVRGDAVVLVGEPLAGPAQAGLHLVEDQQHAALVAELRGGPAR